MTCIVGTVCDGVVYIGGDSAGMASDLSIQTRADEKVFTTDDGQFIMGFAGSFRIGQLLRYVFVAPDQPSRKDDMAYMVADFVDAIRTILRDKGTLKKDSEVEEHDTQVMVGYNGGIYVVEGDFNVSKSFEGYAAIGTGSQTALGAMYALKDMKKMTPEQKINIALTAAAEYNGGVRAPFVILKLEPEVT